MTVITSTEPRDFHGFIVETIDKLEEYQVTGLAIVALTPGESITAYWNLDTSGKAQAEHEIRLDVFDAFLRSNRDRYFDPDDWPDPPPLD